MSYIDTGKFKGTLDPTIPFVTATLPFTTSELVIDTKTKFTSYARAFRIVNNDSIAAITYRQGQASEPLKSIPPSSELLFEGWESFIDIIPNAVSGLGYIEIDLVNIKDAQK